MRLTSPIARRAALALTFCAASPAAAQTGPASASASAAPRELEPGAPPLATQRYRTGIEMYLRGDYAGAAREFKVAQALAPDSAKLAYNLARSLERAGDVPGAVVAYRRYLAVAPQATDRADVERVLAVLEREAAPAPASAEPARPDLVAEAPVERSSESPDGLGARELGVWGLAAGAGAAAIVGIVFAVRASDAKSAADKLSPAETRKHDRLQDTYETGQLGAGIGFGLAAALGLGAGVLGFAF
jgi:tetratricopeptide (TPR) repeat protein